MPRPSLPATGTVRTWGLDAEFSVPGLSLVSDACWARRRFPPVQRTVLARMSSTFVSATVLCGPGGTRSLVALGAVGHLGRISWSGPRLVSGT